MMGSSPQTILDERTPSTLRSDLGMIASIEAPDDRTVVFRLAYPYAPFAQRMMIGIVPRHAFDRVDVNSAVSDVSFELLPARCSR
jgi:peptide/nickel transport system substrate-binding protein